MPNAPEPISEEELRAGDVRSRLPTIRKLAALYNALLNASIRSDTGKEDIQFSDTNCVIEYIKGAGGTATAAPAALSLYDASASGGVLVGARFGNVSPDGSSCVFGQGVALYPSNFASVSDTVAFPVSAAGCVYLVVKVTDGSNATTVTGVTLANGPTLPAWSVPSDPAQGGDYTAYFLVGSYGVAAGKLVLPNVQGIGHQQVGFCNGPYLSPGSAPATPS